MMGETPDKRRINDDSGRAATCPGSCTLNTDWQYGSAGAD
jgi:hypothetical protein